MPNQQSQGQQQSSSAKGQTPPPFPTLPKSIESRVSMKWMTMEALSKVIKMIAVGGQEQRVLILTAWGQIEGRLREIKSSYADSYEHQQGHLVPDLASMVTHIRTDLLKLYEKELQGAASGGGSGSSAQGGQSQSGGQSKQGSGGGSQGKSASDSGSGGGGGSSSGSEEQQQNGLQIVDTAPILSLCDVVLMSGGMMTNLPQITLFADQVIGFSLVPVPEIH